MTGGGKVHDSTIATMAFQAFVQSTTRVADSRPWQSSHVVFVTRLSRAASTETAAHTRQRARRSSTLLPRIFPALRLIWRAALLDGFSDPRATASSASMSSARKASKHARDAPEWNAKHLIRLANLGESPPDE